MQDFILSAASIANCWHPAIQCFACYFGNRLVMFSTLECQHGYFSIVSIYNWNYYSEGFHFHLTDFVSIHVVRKLTCWLFGDPHSTENHLAKLLVKPMSWRGIKLLTEKQPRHLTSIRLFICVCIPFLTESGWSGKVREKKLAVRPRFSLNAHFTQL